MKETFFILIYCFAIPLFFHLLDCFYETNMLKFYFIVQTLFFLFKISILLTEIKDKLNIKNLRN